MFFGIAPCSDLFYPVGVLDHKGVLLRETRAKSSISVGQGPGWDPTHLDMAMLFFSPAQGGGLRRRVQRSLDRPIPAFCEQQQLGTEHTA